MKDININYEGLSFEEKISLKINCLEEKVKGRSR